jgi:hypothetical protein
MIHLLRDGDAQHAEQLPHREYIDDPRHIRKHTLAAAKNGRRENRQRGVFRPAGAHFPS